MCIVTIKEKCVASQSYPRLKADAVLGPEVEYLAVYSMKQIKSRCTILST